jgi:hypothetical protein
VWVFAVHGERLTPAQRLMRFNQSLKYEHLYQHEVDHAATLAEEIEEYLPMFNEIRRSTTPLVSRA